MSVVAAIRRNAQAAVQFWVQEVQPVLNRYRQYGLVAMLAFMVSLGFVGTAAATQTSNSSHYSVTETQFGSGSGLQNCSASYCAKTSTGDTAVGSAGSDSYSAQLGSNTTSEPLVEVTVGGGSQNLGILDSDTTGTTTMLVKVRDYLTNGYVLQIAGAPPSQGSHTLTTLTTPSTSQPGTEQFGINLAANSTPSIGANPVQVPSGSVSFGQVISGDDTLQGTNPNSDEGYFDAADLFMYKDGDIVARSTTSSGETDYTVSMILNVSNVTPGGHYVGTYSAVVTPIF